jgi:hypothetical protein
MLTTKQAATLIKKRISARAGSTVIPQKLPLYVFNKISKSLACQG